LLEALPATLLVGIVQALKEENRMLRRRGVAGLRPPVEVNAALSLDNALNVIERHYHKGLCDFDSIAAHKGAATLLFTLGYGAKGREKWKG
jgi:hypothetical protein